jgi:hypothetical protein
VIMPNHLHGILYIVETSILFPDLDFKWQS